MGSRKPLVLALSMVMTRASGRRLETATPASRAAMSSAVTVTGPWISKEGSFPEPTEAGASGWVKSTHVT